MFLLLWLPDQGQDSKVIVRRPHLDVVQMEKIQKLTFTGQTVQNTIRVQDIDNIKNKNKNNK